jgi:hypothetical protein
LTGLAIIQAADPAPSLLPGMLIFILVVATVLALLASFGLLRLYRRAVLRSMGARGPLRADGHVPSDTLAASGLDRDAAIVPGASAETLYSEALYAPWRTAGIYVVAGFGYALVMAAAFLVSTQLEFSLMRFLLMFWVYAWPVVLTVNLVAAATRRAKLATALVYFLVYAVLGTIAIVRSPALDWGQIALLWLTIEFPPTVLVLAFLNRRVRAVGPLVLVFMILAVTGSQLALSIAGSSRGLLSSIAGFGVNLGFNALGTFIGLMVVGLAVFGPIAWLTLRWIGARYERQKLSDQSITLDAIWLVFGLVESIVLFSGGTVFLFSGLLAFAVYKPVSSAGLRLLERGMSSPRQSTQLLLLRVFSLGRRSERLFDALATHWRHVGNIRLIAGPDLATTTVEPHEFLGFLSGKLARSFIDGPETLDLRLSETDHEPDPDGRFRVSDFFCYDDTWQMVLSRLAGESDAVLMDLRGFSPQNRGVTHEINELIDHVPLGRVVFVVDDTTDEGFLRQTVQEAWARMSPDSPNRSSTLGRLYLFRFTGAPGDLRRLLYALCASAGAESQKAARV